MGMSAEVLAIGPFRRDLVPHLCHPAERFEATVEGALIVERVFYTPEGSSRSRQLASCFGVDPWALGRHALDPFRADLGALRELFAHEARCALHRGGAPASEAACPRCSRLDAVAKFLALREAGHQFFFLPNG
ncbi:hypothetical protein WMF30_43970 [Sorangium sp. So ce134]